jgi:hypothetical protein
MFVLIALVLLFPLGDVVIDPAADVFRAVAG